MASMAHSDSVGIESTGSAPGQTSAGATRHPGRTTESPAAPPAVPGRLLEGGAAGHDRRRRSWGGSRGRRAVSAPPCPRRRWPWMSEVRVLGEARATRHPDAATERRLRPRRCYRASRSEVGDAGHVKRRRSWGGSPGRSPDPSLPLPPGEGGLGERGQGAGGSARRRHRSRRHQVAGCARPSGAGKGAG